MHYREWNGHCQQCGKKTNVSIMSMFDETQICMECKDAEVLSPRYKEAQDAELAAVQSGNYNSKGIGR